MKHEEVERQYGAPLASSLMQRLLVIPSLLLLYPLVVLTICNINATDGLKSLAAVFVLIALYVMIQATTAIQSGVRTLRAFYREFISVDARFVLAPVELDPSLIDNADFSHLQAKTRIARITGLTGRALEAVSHPFRCYFVTNRQGMPISSSKAYAALTGLALLAVRTPSTSQLNSFERFLIFHELEHVNIRGFINGRTLAKMQMLALVNAGVGIYLASSTLQYCLVALFVVIVFYFRWVVMPSGREAVADNHALRKLGNLTEIATVLRLLKIVFAKASATGSFRQRYEARFRLVHVKSYEDLVRLAIVGKLPLETVWLPLRSEYYVNSLPVMFGSACIAVVYFQADVELESLLYVEIAALILLTMISFGLSVASKSLYESIATQLSPQLHAQSPVVGS